MSLVFLSFQRNKIRDEEKQMPKNGQSSCFSSSFQKTICTQNPRENETQQCFLLKSEREEEKKKWWRKNIARARASALKFYLEKQAEANLLKDKEITECVGERWRRRR